MASTSQTPIPEDRPVSSSDRSRPPSTPGSPNKKDKAMIRKKGERGPLPSGHYQEVEPPSLMMVQRALKPYRGPSKRWSLKVQPRPPSAYHDEYGRMLLGGSSGGRYVGDVLGGLPHGQGQHWVKRPPKDTEHMLYEGEWEYGGKTGTGCYHYLNGQVMSLLHGLPSALKTVGYEECIVNLCVVCQVM